MTEKDEAISPELVEKVKAAGETGRVSRPRAKVEKPTAPKSPRAAVSRTGVDDVKVSVGRDSGKSLSVHHIQRRLAERGYGEVYRDRDGFYQEHTQTALEAFAGDMGMDVANRREVLEALFENDSNVNLVD